MAAPKPAGERIGDLLLREGLISREQLEKALQEQKASGTRVGYNLVKLGFIQELELTKTLANGFTAKEVDDAKKAIRDQRIVGRSQDQQLLRLIATREEYGRTLDWDTKMDAKLEALTADQVNAAFKRHVDASAISIVKAGDFKTAGVYGE